MDVKNISRVASLLSRMQNYEAEVWHDYSLFGGCDAHGAVCRALARRRRLLRRQVHGLTGLRASLVARELRKRLSAKWIYDHWQSPEYILGLGGMI